MKQQIATAQATANIGALISLVVSTSHLTTSDFIEKTIGSLRFLYYLYMEKLHTRPRDMTDLVDGLLYLDSVSYIQEREMEKLREVQK